LAWLQQETGHLDEAVVLIKEAIALSDPTASFWDTYGVILNKQNKRDEAIDAFRKALSLETNYPASVINLANVYIAQGNSEGAVNLVNSISGSMYDLSPEHREKLRAIRKKLGFE
ncbi:MAG: tetratricopeptide repeat protein, partial [Verrucomicrobia bacterium]|nr:tetratricopeptide repeat protein [Verrucomicrobiota bacterium]